MTTTQYTYCPQCGCTKLDVDCTSTVTLEFKDTSEPSGQMEAYDGYDFHEESGAECTKCGFSDEMKAFRNDAPFAPVAPTGGPQHTGAAFVIPAGMADTVLAALEDRRELIAEGNSADEAAYGSAWADEELKRIDHALHIVQEAQS